VQPTRRRHVGHHQPAPGRAERRVDRLAPRAVAAARASGGLGLLGGLAALRLVRVRVGVRATGRARARARAREKARARARARVRVRTRLGFGGADPPIRSMRRG